MTVLSPPIEPGVTLLSAPIELAGEWGRMLPQSANTVLERTRRACLDGVRLMSDRQPTRLRVDEHTSGPPAVWLHADGSSTAWIIVDTGERAWAQLAYQFGHELGHVLANSWLPHAKPAGPCQWLEEALVEAFSLRGLGRLAESWKADPPFAGDMSYGEAIGQYRRSIVEQHARKGTEQGGTSDLGAWYARNRAGIEGGGGLNDYAQAAAVRFLALYERQAQGVDALGAMNRWPGRTGLPLPDYLEQWAASCRELGASSALPDMLRKRLLPT